MTDLAANAPDVPARQEMNLTWSNLMAHPTFLVGMSALTVVFLLTLGALALSPWDPYDIAFRSRLSPPSTQHWLGTDNLGRDLFTRLAHGASVSFQVGVAVALFNGIVGTACGALAGYYRMLDGPIMRLMDALMAFPAILLALGIAAALGPSLTNVILALSVTYTPQTARIVRSRVLVLRGLDYIDASRLFGSRDGWILLRHVVPNTLSPLVVQLTSVFAYAVLAETTLSFLGVGLPPPMPSWGSIIADGRDYVVDAWWICLSPGVAITIVVLALNLVGDSLRDVLDPHLKERT